MPARDHAGGGAGVGAAEADEVGPDRGVDHRRHRFPEEGDTLGRGGAAILRPARQAG